MAVKVQVELKGVEIVKAVSGLVIQPLVSNSSSSDPLEGQLAK